MFHRIAPVGNPISRQRTSTPPAMVVEGEQCLLLNSGTAALASALTLARKAGNSQNPEVIMPGYACPDIISAAVYAGVTPVLVDLEPERPYMSLQDISAAINDNTVAITALNFLGIPERINAIRTLIGNHAIVLIEDSAQWYPDTNTPASTHFAGDLVVLSFGKGKPVSLLGGGALLIKKSELTHSLEPALNRGSGLAGKLKQRLMFAVYNTLISPLAYWLLEAMPFIKLGVTNYKTLHEITALDSTRANLLSENIRCYQNRSLIAQKRIHTVADAFANGVTNLPAECDSYTDQRLLRYPILLANAEIRNSVMEKLIQAGVGASPFYPSALPAIAGVAEHIKSASTLTHSANFASRLITLPTHSNVTEKHIATIERILETARG